MTSMLALMAVLALGQADSTEALPIPEVVDAASEKGALYLKIGAGANFFDDLNFPLSGGGSLNQSIDTGYLVGGGGGYEFYINETLSLATGLTIDHRTGDFNGSLPVKIHYKTFDLNWDGDIDTTSLMLDLTAYQSFTKGRTGPGVLGGLTFGYAHNSGSLDASIDFGRHGIKTEHISASSDEWAWGGTLGLYWQFNAQSRVTCAFEYLDAGQLKLDDGTAFDIEAVAVRVFYIHLF